MKRSVIGKHCVIGKMAKVVGCVVLDHCVIGDGYADSHLLLYIKSHAAGRAKLENCLLGKNTKIGSKAELSRCVTQGGYEVDAGGK